MRASGLAQVRQLEMERFSMSKALEGGDKAAAARIKALDKQLNELKKEQGVRSGARGLRMHHAAFQTGNLSHLGFRRYF